MMIQPLAPDKRIYGQGSGCAADGRRAAGKQSDESGGKLVESIRSAADTGLLFLEAVLDQAAGEARGEAVEPLPAGQVVQDAVDALRYTGANNSAHRTQELARTITELDAGHDRVLLARGRAGEWLNRADSLDALMEDRSVDLKTEKSRLEDLDMVKGISDFQTQQLGLEAALKSYAQVQRLSLFQVIN